VDFYEAIKPRSAEITIAGESHVIERARLGRFFRLGELYRKYQEAVIERKSYAVDCLFDYLFLASDIPKGTWESISPLELASAFLRLVELNNAQMSLPIFSDSTEREKKIYDYNGRFVATWVTRLARMYGWSADHILESLLPEEAACYLQEAAIQEFDEREFIYRLSDVAYRYDKTSKTSRYVPLRRPGWMLEPKEAEVEAIKIPRKFIPTGVVIDLETAYGKKESRSDRGEVD